jgi:hypothetical protein
MEPGGPLQSSQEFATELYPEPFQTLKPNVFKIHFKITLQSKPRSSKWALFFVFITEILGAGTAQ